jgi:hypothetical protein
MTGLQLALLHLTTLNCEQSQMASVTHMMLVWKMYTKYMSSLTPQMHSVSPWMCLTTWDNTCPCPFVRCWCPGSDTTQIALSTSTTSLMVWIWKTINSCTSSPPQLALRQGVHQSYLPTLRDAGQSHRCSMAGALCSGDRMDNCPGLTFAILIHIIDITRSLRGTKD